MKSRVARAIRKALKGEVPPPAGHLSRAQLINHVISKIGKRKYLEIGVNTRDQPGYSRDQISSHLIHGVDPNPATEADYVMTSDEFFSDHATEIYDVIFVDGLHTFEQAFKDIENALRRLAEPGVVIVHDTRPTDYSTQTRTQGKTDKWHGDVWRAVLFIRLTRPGLAVTTVDTDEGLTLITATGGSPFSGALSDELFSWRFFVQNYKEILNLVTVEHFLSEWPERNTDR